MAAQRPGDLVRRPGAASEAVHDEGHLAAGPQLVPGEEEAVPHRLVEQRERVVVEGLDEGLDEEPHGDAQRRLEPVDSVGELLVDRVPRARVHRCVASAVRGGRIAPRAVGARGPLRRRAVDRGRGAPVGDAAGTHRRRPSPRPVAVRAVAPGRTGPSRRFHGVPGPSRPARPGRAGRGLSDPGATLRGVRVPRVVEAALARGALGAYDVAAGAVYVAAGLGRGQRRATLAHEAAHAARGDAPTGVPGLDARAEAAAEASAALALLPLGLLADVLRGGGHEHDLAEELDVDTALLRARLAGLTTAEHAYLDRLVRDAGNRVLARPEAPGPGRCAPGTGGAQVDT